jgi:ribonuclease-3
MDFEKNIKHIETVIGYTFKDKSLLKQAFTRTSFCNEHKGCCGARYQSNEVLEFFGDSILSAAIVTLLMKDLAKRYEYGISTSLTEGDFSNIKSKLSDKKNLSLTTKRLDLQKFLLMGEGDAKLGVENEPSVMEDLFESIIGAIYIDSGNDVRAVIASVAKMLDLSGYLGGEGNAPIQSYKNALQEFCADKKRRLPAPVYKTVGESGPDHKKSYERACYIGDKLWGKGIGKNLKLADAAAAEAALSALKADEEKKSRPKAPKPEEKKSQPKAPKPEEKKSQPKAPKPEEKKSEPKASPTRAKKADVKKVSAPTKIKKEPIPSEESLTRLRDYARSNKKTTPEFHDLGESERSTEKRREYRVECRFDGICAVGLAEDKRLAKAAAAEKILKMLKPPKKENKRIYKRK